jgi:hypothetical protein
VAIHGLGRIVPAWKKKPRRRAHAERRRGAADCLSISSASRRGFSKVEVTHLPSNRTELCGRAALTITRGVN